MTEKNKTLLIWPGMPETFWSFRYALKFINKKASSPPLGLLTVAAILPDDKFEKRVVDMNVRSLKDRDIKWADYVFISAISVQQDSVRDVLGRLKDMGKKVIAGGPLFTMAEGEEFEGVDHFVLDEAELTLKPFLKDLERGEPRHIYRNSARAELNATPVPQWDLIKMKKYASMSLQYSRGCPYDCDFCDITLLFGNKPRTKRTEKVIAELDSLYARGWSGAVFFVDDNFIGHKKRLKTELLPELIRWMRNRNYPFTFHTQASIELSNDRELLDLMSEAGFDTVFIGIETPDENSLKECTKKQNIGRDLLSSVKEIQKAGLQVQGGFIVGFDNDPASIFESQISFIQQSGITTAMVGILNALRGTKLYERLAGEKRLMSEYSGDNTDGSINFIPRMDPNVLICGYKNIVSTIYSPGNYYGRLRTFLAEYKPLKKPGSLRIKACDLMAFIKSIFVLGVFGKERSHYWSLLLWAVFRDPGSLRIVVTQAIYGFHFRKIAEKIR